MLLERQKLYLLEKKGLGDSTWDMPSHKSKCFFKLKLHRVEIVWILD